jgi:uroporphyrinogen decarboxylase
MFGGIDPMPLRGVDEVLEETEAWVVRRNGAGAALRLWKGKSGVPEHLAFDLTNRRVWEERYRPHLLEVDTGRIAFEPISQAYTKAKQGDRFLCCHNPFLWENMRNMLGDVCMLESMCADPGWIHDYNRTYTDFYLAHYRVLFDELGLPDGMSISEDLAYNKGLLCSPRLLEELFLPYFAELVDFFHSHALPVTIHSDGNITEALPILVEAGFDAVNPMEVKAGCDALEMAREYGDRLALKGGLDVRVLESGDRALIRNDVTRLVEGMKALGAGYIFGSDHSVSVNVAYRDYEYGLGVYREHMLC